MDTFKTLVAFIEAHPFFNILIGLGYVIFSLFRSTK